MNAMLNTAFAKMLEATVSASILALIVLALQALLRQRLRPAWRCALWLPVLLRLLIPIFPESPFSLFNAPRWLTPTKPVALISANSIPTPPFIAPFPAEQLGSPAITRAFPNPTLNPNPHASPATALEISTIPTVSLDIPTNPLPNPSLFNKATLLQFLSLTWLSISALLLLRLLLGAAWLSLRLARHRSPPDPELIRIAARLRSEVRTFWRPEIIETTLIDSPGLFGCLRPRLLLPHGISARLSEAELRHVFLHEFAHLKRGDLFINWAMSLAQALHWFNPLVWFVLRRMRLERELACDSLALNATAAGHSTAYGQTILKLLQDRTAGCAAPSLVGILEETQTIKMRLRQIAQFVPNQGRSTKTGILLLSLLALIGLSNAQTEQPSGNKAQAAKQESQKKAAILVEDGRQRMEMGDSDEAKHKFREALELEPNSQEANYYLKLADEQELASLRKKVEAIRLPSTFQPDVVDSADVLREPDDIERMLRSARPPPLLHRAGLRELKTEPLRQPASRAGIPTNDVIMVFKVDTNAFLGAIGLDPKTFFARTNRSGSIFEYRSSAGESPLAPTNELRESLRNFWPMAKLDQAVWAFFGAKGTEPRTNEFPGNAVSFNPVRGIVIASGTPEHLRIVARAVNPFLLSDNRPDARTAREKERQYAEEARKREWDRGRTMAIAEGPWWPPFVERAGERPASLQSAGHRTYLSGDQQTIHKKLTNIVLEEFKFAQPTELSEIVKKLSTLVREKDRDKVGVNFIISSFVNKSEVSPSRPLKVEDFLITIDPPLTNARVVDVLDTIVKTAKPPPGASPDGRIKYSVEDYAVVFTLARNESEQLYTRWYQISPNNFINALNIPPGTASTNIQKIAREFFAGKGIDFDVDHPAKTSPRKALFYDDRRGLLFVRTTLADLDLIETTLPSLNVTPQIRIHTLLLQTTGPEANAPIEPVLRLAATNKINAEKRSPMTISQVLSDSQFQAVIGVPDGSAKKTAPAKRSNRAGSGILVQPLFRQVLRELEHRPGIDLATLPDFTTVSGSRIHVADDAPYTPRGAEIDVCPTVGPEGMTISLSAEVAPSSSWFPGLHTGDLIPGFKASANLLDGQTLVLWPPLKPGQPRRVIFITPTLVDPAGNRVHTPEPPPSESEVVPPQ